jgi:hypothetical protein
MTSASPKLTTSSSGEWPAQRGDAAPLGRRGEDHHGACLGYLIGDRQDRGPAEGMADEDARRGQGGTELADGEGQVIGTQAGRLSLGVSVAEVQAEHGQAQLVKAARELDRGQARVTVAEAVGGQHHGLWRPGRQVQPPGQPVAARTGKRERSGLGHGDTFLRAAAG